MESANKESGKLTTHILDIANGHPAKGVKISLHRMNEKRAFFLVGKGETNNDGRLLKPIISGENFLVCTYQLIFHVEEYLNLNFSKSNDEPFLNDIPIQFFISRSSEHYHVPLLLSPFGYSTYRGS